MKPIHRKFREERLEGIGVCQGVAIGRAFLVDDPRGRIVRIALPAEELEHEVARFRAALAQAQTQVRESRERLQAALGEEHSFIFDAHLLMLEDEHLAQQIENFIRENQANAEWAVRDVTNHLIELYTKIADDYLRERSSDVADIAHRLIHALSGTKARELKSLANNSIVIAHELLPSAAAELDTNRVLEHTDNECLNLGPRRCSSIPSPRVPLKAGAATRIELACVPGRPFLLGWDARHHEHIGLTLVSPPPADLRAAAAASAATTTAEPESITVLATNQADARGFVRLFIGCTAKPVVGAPFALSRHGLPSKVLRRTATN